MEGFGAACRAEKILSLQHLLVQLELDSTETDSNIDLNFVRKLSGSVSLGAAQHEWFQDAVQNLDDNELSFLRHLRALSILALVKVEPAVELVPITEDVWHHEVKQTPQLSDVILQWGSCQ